MHFRQIKGRFRKIVLNLCELTAQAWTKRRHGATRIDECDQHRLPLEVAKLERFSVLVHQSQIGNMVANIQAIHDAQLHRFVCTLVRDAHVFQPILTSIVGRDYLGSDNISRFELVESILIFERI